MSSTRAVEHFGDTATGGCLDDSFAYGFRALGRSAASTPDPARTRRRRFRIRPVREARADAVGPLPGGGGRLRRLA
ncbi:hypothetical protein Shyhy01_25170 [Streptomyces hygroscopicus subsp. hygroscopicus]|nr:hypothetical protein Shyhy01_25170 [Streptomyces hygroscopicus subsp. hygroscopicus]